MADWEKLLSPRRLRAPSGKPDPYDKRSNFDSDYDRVVFSSSFRRLQDKTQVFPLEAHDFVRTRLTHSSEVAAVGRSLAVSAARRLQDDEVIRGDQQRDWSTIVATACLLHDIGNPPFGHSGEKYISSWFSQKLAKPKAEALVRVRPGAPLEITAEQEILDLTKFEGNAHAFRVATRLQTLGDDYGMNLTCGTLAALMKYPCASHQSKKEGDKKSRAKFGFFKSDSVAFNEVRAEVGLPEFRRHPLTFLVEAADDICYSVVDIEDALKKRVVTFDLIEAFLQQLPGDLKAEFLDERLKKRFEELSSKSYSLSNAQQLAFQNFRAFAVGKMIGSCVKVFCENFAAILAGEFDFELTARMELHSLCATLKDLGAQHVYSSSEVVKVEEAGKHVVWGLLDLFYDEIKFDAKSRLVQTLLPPTPANPKDENNGCSEEYKLAQRVADYVGGMTDTFAVSLYRRLTGGVT